MKEGYLAIAIGFVFAALYFGHSFGVMEQKNTIVLRDNSPTIGSYCRTDWEKYQRNGLPQIWKNPRTGKPCAELGDLSTNDEPFKFMVILSNKDTAMFSSWYNAVEWVDEQPVPKDSE